MDVMGLIGTATGVVSLAILVAQEARHFGDMPAISSASSKYRTILENNGSADATDVLVIQRDMSEPRPDSPRWKFQAIRAHDSARLDDARTDDETWFEVIYDHPHRRNRKIMTWCPARNDSNLARELFARSALPWWRRLPAAWRTSRLHVGPQGRRSAVVRSDQASLARLRKRVAGKAEKARRS